MRVLKVSSSAGCLALLLAMSWVTVQGQQYASPEQRRVKERDLLFVTAQGTAYVTPHSQGLGVLVFDVLNDFKFLKRIPTWDVPVSKVPEPVVGIAASPAAGLLYLAMPTKLAAIDLTTDKMAWEQTYDGRCCEMIATSPDGKTLYLNSNYASHFYLVDAKTGALIKKVEYPPSFEPRTKIQRAHNLVWSADGSRVFLGGSGKEDLFMATLDTKTNTIVKAIGPFSDSVRQFTTNGRGSLLFVNTVGLCGFEIADTNTGKVIHRVECPTDWKVKIKDPNLVLGHGTPSHGIAMSPDEKEIWVVDGVDSFLHVYDSTVMPPKYVTRVKTRQPPYTVSFGLDGKYVFSMSGDVINAKTKQVVAGLKDEYGRNVYSEKMIEATFSPDGKMLRAIDRFSKGAVIGTN